MSLLWRLVFTSRCTSTHHKLALDALRFLRGPMADLWSNLFLANHEQYLAGSKAPDDVFKDFKNHVLHVEQGFWGGATLSARTWYDKTVAALNQGNWPDAIYNAGVLSHYFTDPFQPFHTGQTEAEGKVHRAAEWSIAKSYEELQAILEQDLGGYPQYELPERPDWLEEAIRAGATEAHSSYFVCIDHYDLSRGIKNPPSGLDQEMKDRLARLIGLASVGFSRVLERAFEEAAATPPDVAVSLHAFLAALKMPLNWIMRKITDARERAVVEAIYLEVQEKGKAIDSLPEDEKVVRKLHAQEVLRVPLRELDAEPVKPAGSQYGAGTPARGLTAKASSAMAFERTTVSAPLRTNQAETKDALAGLESCLMVPLAVSKPVDHVAETAMRALLSQSTTKRSVSAESPAGLVAVNLLNRGTLPATNPDVDFLPVAAGPSAPDRVNAIRPTLNSMNPTQQPSLSRPSGAPPTTTGRSPRPRHRTPADTYPEITPPSTTLGKIPNLTSDTIASTELITAMFAPLPPMPPVKPPKPIEKPSLAAAGSPSPTTVAGLKPTQQPIPPASPQPRTTQQAVPQARPQVAPAVRSNIVPKAAPSQPRMDASGVSQKSYIAEPAQSPIPNPHIRPEDSSSDDGRSREWGDAQAELDQPVARPQQPRIVVAKAQAGTQHVNRLPTAAPDRPQSVTSNRAASEALTPATFNFLTSGGQSAPVSSSSTVAQSSLFAALNAPAAPRTEVAPVKQTVAAATATPPNVPQDSTAAVPRPNMFLRPLSAPVQPRVPQPVTVHPAPVRTTTETRQVPTDVASEPTPVETEVPRTPKGTSKTSRERRFYLDPSSPLTEAPSIGPKTAGHFAAIGVRTVFDLFKINTDQAAEKLGKTHITTAVLKDWQAQALLVCRVSELRGHDAQYLVGCNVRTAEQLANCEPQELLGAVEEFLGTTTGQRLLRGAKVPDLEEVTDWVTSARDARSLRAE